MASSVLDIAFVFHCETIISGRYANAHGMSNSYFTRYKIFTDASRRHSVSIYHANEHIPFSHLMLGLVIESFHHREYVFLTEM